MNTPLISVIIIFLNGETFIEEAIQSIFSQTYEHWELLLVDDGSTDRSTAIAQKYAQQYPEKVRYLEHESHQNRGMSASRNLGITHSKGEYIAFLDADDVWLSKKLEKQLGLFEKYPEAAMVCGPTQWWYSWTADPNHNALDSMREIVRQYDHLYKPPFLLKELLLERARTPATCSVLIRRSLFDEIGVFEDQFKGLYEDQAFFSKVYLKANIYVSHEYWDLYRQHSENHCLISEQTGQGTPGHLSAKHQYFLKWLEQYLLTENVQDSSLIKALNKALWAYQHQGLYYCLHPERFLRMIGRTVLPFTMRQWLWNRYVVIKGVDL